MIWHNRNYYTTQNFDIGEPLTTSIVEYWFVTDTRGIKYIEHLPVSLLLQVSSKKKKVCYYKWNQCQT